MTVPTQFRKGDAAIASYDAFDIAAGTGFITFFGGQTSSAITGPLHHLSTIEFWSHALATRGSTTNSAAFENVLNINFDVEFNRPLNIKGDAVINIPLRIDNISNTNTSYGKTSAEIKILRESGNTSFVAAGSGGIFTETGGVDTYFTDCIKMSIPDTVHIKAGETLRLNILAYGLSGTSAETIYEIGHDPKNRATASNTNANWGSVPTILQALIPVKIDLGG